MHQTSIRNVRAVLLTCVQDAILTIRLYAQPALMDHTLVMEAVLLVQLVAALALIKIYALAAHRDISQRVLLLSHPLQDYLSALNVKALAMLVLIPKLLAYLV